MGYGRTGRLASERRHAAADLIAVYVRRDVGIGRRGGGAGEEREIVRLIQIRIIVGVEPQLHLAHARATHAARLREAELGVIRAELLPERHLYRTRQVLLPVERGVVDVAAEVGILIAVPPRGEMDGARLRICGVSFARRPDKPSAQYAW